MEKRGQDRTAKCWSVACLTNPFEQIRRDRTCEDRTGQDRTRQDRTGQSNTGQDSDAFPKFEWTHSFSFFLISLSRAPSEAKT